MDATSDDLHGQNARRIAALAALGTPALDAIFTQTENARTAAGHERQKGIRRVE
jgi:hypothetical protein